jgi:cupin fold WbuC family metalloprotein
MRLRKVSDEVFVASEQIVRLGSEEIDFLKKQAVANPRKRARICAHSGNDDAIHEMVIAISSSSYVRPHKHIGKSESFHVIDGSVDVVMFDDDGAIADVIELGGLNSGRNFYYRLSESRFHMPLSRTDMLIIHEVTNGPFNRNQTIFAPFAPPEDDIGRAEKYLSEVSAAVSHRFKSRENLPQFR